METGSSRSREVLLPGGPLFRDRVEAGRLLAAELQEGAAPEAVVFGLARGGVVVAAEVASALGAPLDALAVRKIGHLFQPEYAIGAVTPDQVYLRAHDGLTDEQVAEAVAGAQAKAAALDARLHERVPRLDPSERTRFAGAHQRRSRRARPGVRSLATSLRTSPQGRSANFPMRDGPDFATLSHHRR